MLAWILVGFSVIVFVSGSLGGIVSTLYMGGQVPGRQYDAARTDRPRSGLKSEPGLLEPGRADRREGGLWTATGPHRFPATRPER